MKFTSLLANLVTFHNTLDIADVARQLQAEGWEIDPLDLAEISPYLTEHINRFGAYSTHEIGITPEDYDTRLDVDSVPWRRNGSQLLEPPGSPKRAGH
ncbi:transposase [Streptomyces sp. NBC_01549]|uniref:Tn3 family transposase n=1 Tax=Streptomyces sp. NBC_01549 TaxID=2975874 RepID=UPI00225BCC25|nr:Tn3 family transposase [Streptomyces sp. NBC_01549]MCX4596499.1 transposase [Streptomyces sp. NBC_01549]